MKKSKFDIKLLLVLQILVCSSCFDWGGPGCDNSGSCNSVVDAGAIDDGGNPDIEDVFSPPDIENDAEIQDIRDGVADVGSRDDVGTFDASEADDGGVQGDGGVVATLTGVCSNPAVVIDNPDESFFEHGEFALVTLPLLLSGGSDGTPSCATADCHLADGTEFGDFRIYANALTDPCSRAMTYDSFISKINLNLPLDRTSIFRILIDTDRHSSHPKIASDSNLANDLRQFISSAKSNKERVQYIRDFRVIDISASPFDFGIYSQSIADILENANPGGVNCADSTCHSIGIGGLTLTTRGAGSVSTINQANFVNIIDSISLTLPSTQTAFYRAASTVHAGGLSNVLSQTELNTISNWIEDARGNASVPPGGCASPVNYNLDVFRAEIQPILFGHIDYNNLQETNVTSGCLGNGCHEADRFGGALVIKRENSAQDNLRALTCFINETNPTLSEVFLCAIGSSECSSSNHPGGQLWQGSTDANYQRLMQYITTSSQPTTPIDFSYFAALINPILTSSGLAANGGCANLQCHGFAGEQFSGTSNFKLFQNETNLELIEHNFRAAAAFTNFLVPEASSLFLYPTDEISNVDNIQAVGVTHSRLFESTSVPAENIRRWAGGLRLEPGGGLTDWLVVGTFGTSDLLDNTVVNEATVAPGFGDRVLGADAQNGNWTVRPAERDFRAVNLDSVFEEATASRTAYAVSYLLNLSEQTISARLNITTNVDMHVYVNGLLSTEMIVGTSSSADGVTVLSLPPFSTTRQTTKVLLKMFQNIGAGQEDMQFSAILQETDSSIPLDNFDGRVVIKLGPEGIQ